MTGHDRLSEDLGAEARRFISARSYEKSTRKPSFERHFFPSCDDGSYSDGA